MFGSLKTRLVMAIGVIQLVTWGLIFAVGGVHMWSELEEGYDVELIQFAMAVTGVVDAIEESQKTTIAEELVAKAPSGMTNEYPPPGFTKDDLKDHLVQVAHSGRIIFRSQTAPATVLDVPNGINDLTFDGVKWKTFGQVDRTNGNHVVVAIRRSEVDTTIIATLVSVFLPLFGAALMGLLLTSFLVSRLLKPLEGWARHIGEISPYDTDPIDDRTALKEVRPVLVALNRMMERVRESIAFERRFVRDAAHELRTPLTAIRAQIEGTDWTGLSDEQDMRMHKVKFGVRRASRLVNQLMDLARSEEPRSRVRETPVEIGALVGTKLTEIINASSITDPTRISFSGLNHPRWLSCNPHDIEVVLSNLVDNAVKYAGDKAMVDVSLAQADGHVIITVEDDGPGIPEAKREDVFKRFVRLSSTTSYGSGLGLALVKEIVTRLGGEVSLGRSERLGGLMVTIRLPYEASQDDVARSTAASKEQLRAAG